MLNNLSEITTTFSNATLSEAIEKLYELKNRIRDFVLPVQSMKMNKKGHVLIDEIRTEDRQMLESLGVETEEEDMIVIKPNKIANGQIATRLKIPTRYWNKMLGEHPELMAQNFNGWIEKEVEVKGKEKSRRMLVRAYMDEKGGNIGTFRALLSDSYFVYDNLDLLAVALKAVKEANDKHGLNIQVDKCDLTDSKLFVRFVCPTIEAQSPKALKDYKDPDNGRNGGVGVSNGIVSGFVLSNSEVGAGRTFIAPRVMVLACRNGMIWNDEAYSKIHLGGKMTEGEVIWTEETKKKNILLIESQIKDMVKKYIDPEYLGARVKDIEEMVMRKLNHPFECVKNMATSVGLTEEETGDVFDYFLKQGDTGSVFSVAQAITSFAHTCEPEKRFKLESDVTGLLKIADRCDRVAVNN